MQLKVIKSTKSRSSGENSSSRRILRISDNSQIGLWVVRSLGRSGLTVFNLCCSHDDLAGFSRYVTGAWLLDIQAASSKYVEAVFEYATKLDVGSIMTVGEESHKVRHE